MATMAKQQRRTVAVLLFLAVNAVVALSATDEATIIPVNANNDGVEHQGGLRAHADLDEPATDQSPGGYLDKESVGDKISLEASFEDDRHRSTHSFPEERNLIVGGNKAKRSYPSFASMRGEKLRRGSWKSCDGEESNYCWAGCGGALISKRHVLTAGHCMDDVARKKLKLRGFRVGAKCRGDICHDDAEFGEAEWNDVDIHPDYNEDGKGMPENDVAIVVLRNDISLDYAYVDTGNILDELMERNPPMLTAIGHGKTSSQYFSSSSKTLLEAHFWGLQEDFCEREFGEKYHGEKNGDGAMFCAGQYDYDQPETSVCNGDSGGPLYSLNDQENSQIIHLPPGRVREVQVGITSWGRKSCQGGVENPSVFAKVSTMIEWFGPKVCNYFQYNKDRPIWCNVCSSNSKGNPPRWCEDVKDPIDKGIPGFRIGPDSPGQNFVDDGASSSGSADTPEENPSDKENVPSDAPTNAPTIKPAAEEIVPIVEDIINVKCRQERLHKHCTFGGGKYTFCTCGFIQDLDPSDRRDACRRATVEKQCALSCAEKCSALGFSSVRALEPKKDFFGFY